MPYKLKYTGKMLRQYVRELEERNNDARLTPVSPGEMGRTKHTTRSVSRALLSESRVWILGGTLNGNASWYVPRSLASASHHRRCNNLQVIIASTIGVAILR